MMTDTKLRRTNPDQWRQANTSDRKAHDTATDAERSPVMVWGLPLAPLSMAATLARVDSLIRRRAPRFFITANLHYAMLSASDSRLAEVNRAAAFVVADGMPLVWASRWSGQSLPERVTGSDLVPALCGRAAEVGHRVLLLGGAPGVAEEAAVRLRSTFPKLHVAGMNAPRFRRIAQDENAALVSSVRDFRPDLLLAACAQPDGEIWLAENCERLGVPACGQVGAAIDFAAGRVRRAPSWTGRIGLEWAYRLCRDPLRLGPRYWHNALFLARQLGRRTPASLGLACP
jgi:N-acetylglucosaminyldiphosphoundecaprenol N-acetyl-beta-D-mannosaminyltransferase